MPINISRSMLARRGSNPRIRQFSVQRNPRIAEVFEDLATESTVELIVYETFLDLNPQVKNFPNLNPSEPIYTGESRANISSKQADMSPTVNSNKLTNSRKYRRDIIRGFRVR